MCKSSTTTPAVWPCMSLAASSRSATQCVTPTTIYCARWGAKECDDRTGGNGPTITVWGDSYGESVCFDALNLSSMSIYAKTDVKTRLESSP